MNISEENSELARRHNELQMTARKHYNTDFEYYKNRDNTKIYAVDMQKVLLLPRMPDIKESFFLSKMVVFNETFASLKPEEPHFSIIWYEAIRGRSASDVTSAYMKIINNSRDTPHFIFWADNCTAQNKNWTLFSTFALIVNEPTGPESITIKYLVPGHTFLAADGLHGRIEQTIRKKKNLYDLRDLTEAIEESAKRMQVIELNIQDFSAFENLKKARSKTRAKKVANEDVIIPHLQNLCQVRFEKGLCGMIFKENFEEDGIVSLFLKDIPKSYIPKKLQHQRGMKKSKLDKIKLQLVSRMPGTRRKFWEELT